MLGFEKFIGISSSIDGDYIFVIRVLLCFAFPELSGQFFKAAVANNFHLSP